MDAHGGNPFAIFFLVVVSSHRKRTPFVKQISWSFSKHKISPLTSYIWINSFCLRTALKAEREINEHKIIRRVIQNDIQDSCLAHWKFGWRVKWNGESECLACTRYASELNSLTFDTLHRTEKIRTRHWRFVYQLTLKRHKCCNSRCTFA